MSDVSGKGPGPMARCSLGRFEPAVARRLELWQGSGASARIWQKDPTFWPQATPADVASRLGWLDLPHPPPRQLAGLTQFAEEVRKDGTTDVVVLGMGGSSLAPQVYAETFAPRTGFPRLQVLDSTHPRAVEAVRQSIDPAHTLFVVSSKSGTTLEPNAFQSFFWDETVKTGTDPGPHFVAITDPDTALDRLATERGFRWVCRAPPDVGGRYSALTVFGLLPAALMGVDVTRLIERSARMAASCGPGVGAGDHPALVLAAAIGEAAVGGADKLVFATSPSLSAFPSWGEQLVAESTGKIGKGVVPVADEVDLLDPLGRHDRLLVCLKLQGESDRGLEEGLAALRAAGEPVVEVELADRFDLGAEFFRWEMAIAAAGSVVGIDPFDQPDVELAKNLARDAMKSPPNALAPPDPNLLTLSGGPAFDAGLSEWIAGAPVGGYAAIQAYLPPTPEMTASLRGLRENLRLRLRTSTTFGYGPRFLHSTGQLHKGGPATGAFLQLVDDAQPPLSVPGMDATFGRILRAQASGDAAALRLRGRHLLTVDLASGGPSQVDRLAEAIHG
ncbi:MAG: hypothetical protein L3K19_08820 [Thermoplasmata archaeon]|nr:hypothetical protein [Thermoplasmata archaeon]